MAPVVHLPDEVAAILTERAAERGLTVPQLISDMVLPPSRPRALDEFIGSASVPVDEPFEIRRARQELADELLADQRDLSADLARRSAPLTGPSIDLD